MHILKNMDKDLLYEKVKKVIERGNNAEIRKNPDGTWVVYEVKKNKVV